MTKGTTRKMLYQKPAPVRKTGHEKPVKKKIPVDLNEKDPEPKAAIPDRERIRDLSGQVHEFLASRPLIAVRRLAMGCGVDQANLCKKLPIPRAGLEKMVVILKDYGFEPA